MNDDDPDFRTLPQWAEDGARVVGMMLLLLLGAVLMALPAIVTGDMRCLVANTFECHWWWLP